MAITFPFIKELDFSVVEQDFNRLLNSVTLLLDGKVQKCLTTEISLYADPVPNKVTIGYETCLDRRTCDIKVSDLILDIENYVKVNYKAYYEIDTDVRQEPHIYATLYERSGLDVFILLLESPTDVRVRVMTDVELSDTIFPKTFFRDRLEWMKDWIAVSNHLIAQVDKYTLYFNDNMDIVSILCSETTEYPCNDSCITTEIKNTECSLKPMTVFGKMEDCLVMDSPYMTTCLFPFKAQKISHTQTGEYFLNPCWVRQTEFRAESLFRYQPHHDICSEIGQLIKYIIGADKKDTTSQTIGEKIDRLRTCILTGQALGYFSSTEVDITLCSCGESSRFIKFEKKYYIEPIAATVYLDETSTLVAIQIPFLVEDNFVVGSTSGSFYIINECIGEASDSFYRGDITPTVKGF